MCMLGHDNSRTCNDAYRLEGYRKGPRSIQRSVTTPLERLAMVLLKWLRQVVSVVAAWLLLNLKVLRVLGARPSGRIPDAFLNFAIYF